MNTLDGMIELVGVQSSAFDVAETGAEISFLIDEVWIKVHTKTRRPTLDDWLAWWNAFWQGAWGE